MSSSLTRNPNLDLTSPAVHKHPKDDWQRNLGRWVPSFPRDDSWWTGPNPKGDSCPGRSAEGWISALKAPDLTSCKRSEVKAYFDNGWVLTELLFAALTEEEAFYRPPYHGLRHPLIFYYMHPAVLFVNKLHVAGLLDTTPNAYFERIFEVGVDEMSWDDLSKNEMEWPDIAACRDYRRQVYQIVATLIATHDGLVDAHAPITMDSPLWALFMGMEHERIHLETSSVLMRELPVRLVQRPPFFVPLHPTARSYEAADKIPWRAPEAGRDYPANSWRNVAAGTSVIGKPRDFPSYGWDNEYGQDVRDVAAFQCQQHMVTNGEYYEFVKAGGYREARFWSEDGWRWRSFRNIKLPTFWIPIGAQGAHEYGLRTCFERVHMPWDWPVVVNHYEAKAYASWLTEKDNAAVPRRLLTEAEHYRLRSADFGQALDHLRFGSEGPVARDAAFADVFGNVWQWLEDHFHPLDGFRVHPYYDDFSTPCFDGRHQMIAGGSFISIGDETSIHARFHFRPHFFQHAGFRLVDPLQNENDGAVQTITQERSLPQGFAWSSEALAHGFQMMTDALRPFWDHFNERAPAPSLPTQKFFNDTQPPEKGEDLNQLLQSLVQNLSQHDERVGHPGYMAYVAGAAQPVAAIGQALAMLLNPYTGTYATAPTAVQLEEQVIRWLLTMMNFPEDGGGWITTGSSMAIFSAVIAARQTHAGPFGQRRVYVSDQAHHCIGKALFAAGFLPEETFILPTVDGRLSPAAVQQQIQKDREQGLYPLLLFATAGTTNTGRVDPLDELATIADREKLWYHVDAAYGGFFRLVPECTVLKGIERSDSLSLDPHKSLYMPYGTGVLLMRDAKNLQWPRGFESSYMQQPDPEQPNYSDMSPELSRDFRGLRLWLSLKTFGLENYRRELSEKWQIARQLAGWIQAEPKLELTAAPDLSLLAFRVREDQDDRKTAALLLAINRSQRFYLTACRYEKRLQIRVCVLGFRTKGQTIQDLMDHIRLSLSRI
jgi:5-histidylcysteine sulfoxide synthase